MPEGEWEVRCIKGERRNARSGKRQLLVEWEPDAEGAHEDTWEPEAALREDCPGAVERYEEWKRVQAERAAERLADADRVRHVLAAVAAKRRRDGEQRERRRDSAAGRGRAGSDDTHHTHTTTHTTTTHDGDNVGGQGDDDGAGRDGDCGISGATGPAGHVSDSESETDSMEEEESEEEQGETAAEASADERVWRRDPEVAVEPWRDREWM